MTVLTWFDQKSLSSLIPDHAVIIGGTILVHEFMSLVEESAQPGQLLIAVPYITAALVAETGTWQGVVHERLDCTLVTRNSATLDVYSHLLPHMQSDAAPRRARGHRRNCNCRRLFRFGQRTAVAALRG